MSNTVIARDSFGRFVSAIKAGGAEMMADMARDGADLSRAYAPKGGKPDARTPRIVDSIFEQHTSTTAQWGSTARHALPQETGGVPHLQRGDVSFFWEREGRRWRPGQNMINHPGNPAQPYLRPAYENIMARWMDYARRHFPQ